MPCYSCVSRSADPESRMGPDDDDAANGSAGGLAHVATAALHQYGLPLGQFCITFLYGLYRRFTFINMTVFLLKYVPTGMYMYKMLKDIYITSRERIKQKQMELDDIQLQIQIMNTKLCVRDAEFSEREEQLRRGAARLRAVRARVRDMIDADDALRRALDASAPWGDDPEMHMHSTPEEDRDFIIALLKELKSTERAGEVAITERPPEKMDCGEHFEGDDSNAPDHSVYSSLSDAEAKQDCRVKIVKVTNVYKVAYLKHYIKQRRLRKATQQALLKKKIESIQKLLEGWQKSLNTVINSKILLDSTPIDLASQEAMGDYSKPNFRDSSDSDSDLKTSGTDTCNDEYSLSWSQNPYKSPYTYNFDDLQEPTAVAKEFYDSQELNDLKYPSHPPNNICECNGPKAGSNVLFILPEETSSQVAIEEIKTDADEFDTDCRDIIAL